VNGLEVGEHDFLGKATRKALVAPQQLVDVRFVTCKNYDELVHELGLGQAVDNLGNCLAGILSLRETVGFIDEEYLANGFGELVDDSGTGLANV